MSKTRVKTTTRIRVTTKQLREKSRMIEAVKPLVFSGVWTVEQFDTYCANILVN